MSHDNHSIPSNPSGSGVNYIPLHIPIPNSKLNPRTVVDHMLEEWRDKPQWGLRADIAAALGDERGVMFDGANDTTAPDFPKGIDISLAVTSAMSLFAINNHSEEFPYERFMTPRVVTWFQEVEKPAVAPVASIEEVQTPEDLENSIATPYRLFMACSSSSFCIALMDKASKTQIFDADVEETPEFISELVKEMRILRDDLYGV